MSPLLHADPVFRALDPNEEDGKFLGVRWLPPELNPYAEYQIKIGAVYLTRFPNIKSIAVMQMMTEDLKAGRYQDAHVLVIPSSGNAAYIASLLARALGFSEVKVILAADVPASKKEIFSALSTVDVIVVSKGRSVEDRAKDIARQAGHVLLDQYTHLGNMRAHQFFTGPEMARVLGPNVAAIAIAMGSGGTVSGVGRFFKERFLSGDYRYPTRIVGVRPRLGERVPGVRDEARMKEVVTLPWRENINGVVEVSRKEAFIQTRALWSWVVPQPGPSSGLAYAGLTQYLNNLGKDGLEELRGKCVAFLCTDGYAPYLGLMLSELDPDQGLPVSI